MLNSPTPALEHQRRRLRVASVITTLVLAVGSLLVGLLFTGASVWNDTPRQLVAVILTFHGILLVALLIAFRWECVGGITVLVTAAVLGLIVLSVFLQVPAATLGGVLVTALWVAPFVLFGLLFLRLHQQSRRAA